MRENAGPELNGREEGGKPETKCDAIHGWQEQGGAGMRKRVAARTRGTPCVLRGCHWVVAAPPAGTIGAFFLRSLFFSIDFSDKTNSELQADAHGHRRYPWAHATSAAVAGSPEAPTPRARGEARGRGTRHAHARTRMRMRKTKTKKQKDPTQQNRAADGAENGHTHNAGRQPSLHPGPGPSRPLNVHNHLRPSPRSVSSFLSLVYFSLSLLNFPFFICEL